VSEQLSKTIIVSTRLGLCLDVANEEGVRERSWALVLASAKYWSACTTNELAKLCSNSEPCQGHDRATNSLSRNSFDSMLPSSHTS